MIALKSGKPYPLGATITDGGVNFAVFSENAERINLEIFRSIYDSEPAEVIELKEKTAHVWHVLVPGLKVVHFTVTGHLDRMTQKAG